MQKKHDCVLRFRSDRYHMLMDLKVNFRLENTFACSYVDCSIFDLTQVKHETLLVLAALEADIFL